MRESTPAWSWTHSATNMTASRKNKQSGQRGQKTRIKPEPAYMHALSHTHTASGEWVCESELPMEAAAALIIWPVCRGVNRNTQEARISSLTQSNKEGCRRSQCCSARRRCEHNKNNSKEAPLCIMTPLKRLLLAGKQRFCCIIWSSSRPSPRHCFYVRIEAHYCTFFALKC